MSLVADEEEDKEVFGERSAAGNCRDCKHWNVKDMAEMNKRQAMQGYGKCNKRASLMPMAGWSCADWEQAEARSIEARRRFFGGYL